MILSFDADENQVWTVEGNYNARVERAERAVDASWKLGHLAPPSFRKSRAGRPGSRQELARRRLRAARSRIAAAALRPVFSAFSCRYGASR